MPLCPQITNTPITVTQTGDFTVSSVIPAVGTTVDGLVVDLDGKTKAYYQTTAPTGATEGDIWFDTDDGNKQYFYNGTAWVSVQDTAIAAAQAAATAAQTTADGKNKVYRQTTQPTTGPFAEGDLWFDTDDDNRIYRYTSGSWATAVTLGNNAIANLSASKLTAGTIDASVITVSNINAGNISTGTLNADRIAAASITGTKLVAGTITADKIATATITATQIASGTITATQISSGYVYAGTISADQINAGTLTGRTVTATSGTKTVTLDSSSGILSVTDTSTGLLSGGGLIVTSSGVSGTYGARVITLGSTVAFSNDGSGNAYIQAGATGTIRLSPGAGLGSATYNVSVEGHLNTIYTLSAGNYSTSSTAQSTGVYLSDSGAVIGRRDNQIPLFAHRYNATGTAELIRLNYNGADAGGINTSSAGSPSFRTTSDYRLKQDIQDFTGSADIIKATRLRSFKMNREPDKTVVGFVAHEFAEAAPDLVMGEKDAVDADGNPEYQSIMTTNLIPYLTGALKDIILRVEALEQGNQMNTEIDVNEILAAMREQIGSMAQDIAILKATIKKLNDAAVRDCGCSQND